MATAAERVFGNADLRGLLLRRRAEAMAVDLVHDLGRMQQANVHVGRLLDGEFGAFRRRCEERKWHWKHVLDDAAHTAAKDLWDRGHALVREMHVLHNVWRCDVSLDASGFTLMWLEEMLFGIRASLGEPLPARRCRRMEKLRAMLREYRTRLLAAVAAAVELRERLVAFEARYPLLCVRGAALRRA